MVIDYKKLNEVILDEKIHIPKIFQEIQALEGMDYYSSIDLRNGFNQIPLHEKTKKYTGFIVGNQHYQYNRVPLGYKQDLKYFKNYDGDVG